MLTEAENALLCRVEGEAPMGRFMRQHWLPVCLSEDVEEPEGKPVRVKVLGEPLVAYRDGEGRVGLVGEFCPHRKASLVYGRNEEGGLRCLYHGWKVDADGAVVEMPSEPPEACAAAKLRHLAYPTAEAGGFVWAWMGDREAMPEFEPPPFAPTPETRVSIGSARVDCNWAQVVEGQIDSAHSSTLHSSDMVPARVGRAEASAIREKLLAEVAGKLADAEAVQARMLAEAEGLRQKADAMKGLGGESREHEEFRLRLQTQKDIAMQELQTRITVAEQQALILSKAFEKASINIVGGDGAFFDRFVKAVGVGSSIDGAVQNSKTLQALLADHLGDDSSLGDELKKLMAPGAALAPQSRKGGRAAP